MSATTEAPQTAGRVVARYGQRYLVATAVQAGTAATEFDAIARGRRMDVVVGDLVQCSQEPELLVIESVLPRRSLLFRADAMRTKPLAANVDQVAIVFAPQPAPHVEFLWSALLAARAAGIDALAILNKTDLPGDAARAVLRQLEGLRARCLAVAARTDAQATRDALLAQCAGRATLFMGQSGMGKSTLLGLLVGATLRTGELSRRSGQGRQTTTSTRWLELPGGGAVVDSPGFQEFGLAHLDAAQLLLALPDFAAVLDAAPAGCRFANCRHFEEPDCVIRAAVADGRIAAARYAFFRNICAAIKPRY